MRIYTRDHACTCGAQAAHARAHTRDGITASGVLSAEQIGARQSVTPEGFLLCEEVPIARVGAQDYAYFELPELEAKDGVIVAERTADVLFSPETLASFEGKPITIDHPPDFVTPANYMSVARGTVRNVRRGDGEQSNLMLADLLITDAEAIRRVQSKDLTQVSNGYDADYEQIAPGRARQATIVGNHVALVKNARCGPVCSIGDSRSNLLPTGDPNMAKKKPVQSTLLEKLRKAFMTRDSDTFEQVASEMTGDEGNDEPGNGQPQIHIHMPGAADPKAGVTSTGDEGGGGAGGADDPLQQILAAVKAVDAKVDQVAARVTTLEGGGTPTGDGDGNDDDDDDDTSGSGGGDGKGAAKTGDSKDLADEFQDALSRAEILAPGVRLPTFDAKAERKKTADAICVLRRRALRASLDNEHADLVKPVLGGADVATMPCDSVKAFFNAAAELVRGKNSSVTQRKTNDSANTQRKNINEVHADFWKNRK